MKQPTSDILRPLKKRKLALKPKPITPATSEETQEASAGVVPRITNETVATHREDVLKSARKYIYPLQHSKNRIIIISTSIFVAVVIAFFTYCTLALYRFQSYSTFLYKVTQVIP